MNAHHIKFSHHYPKIHGQTSATLLAVVPLKIDRNTPRSLLDYDTTYYDRESGAHKFYPQRHGNYIQLIFLGNLRIPFCTIRSAWPQSKVDYYKSAIGYDFDIIIEESEVRDGEKR